MAISTSDLKELYIMFNDEAFKKITDYQKETQMEDESLALVMSETIKGAMSSSVSALSVLKDNEVKDSQIAGYNKDLLLKDAQIVTEGKKAEDLISTTTVRNEQSAKDLLLKDAQISTESKKRDDLTSTIAVRDAQSAKDLLIKDAQKDMISKQALTEAQRPALVTRQKTAYDDKNRVEKAKALLNTQGMIGASGSVPDAALVSAGMAAAVAI